MYAEQPKKFLILNILDILRKYTDENHRLSQKEIEKILAEEYGMKAERKAISRNLRDLIEYGYDIEYRETVRNVTDPKTGVTEETSVLTDFYLVNDFTDSELRLLIDSMLFSKSISYTHCKALVEKLEKLTSKHFRSRIQHISKMPQERTDNKQVFLNIEMIDEAINRKNKISFQYLAYGTDKKQTPKHRSDGGTTYTVSPYQMAAQGGSYYLICNLDGYDNIANYRIDRIRDIKILEEPIKPFSTLEGSNGRQLDLAEYMKKHAYMYSSDECTAKLWVKQDRISDVIDRFGKDVEFSDERGSYVKVSVCASELSIEQFARNYAPNVIALEPEHMRSRMIEALKKTTELYETLK